MICLFPDPVLQQKAQAIDSDQFDSVKAIEEQLLAALQPYFPAAGLAAPQIGIRKSVFIYSYDRDPAHLETVVNPTFTPLSDEKIVGWEGCLSCPHLAKVARYKCIKVRYYSREGTLVEKVLDGFAAKVFQHEYDHLQGILVINRPDAEVKAFETEEAMRAFLAEVKKQDAAHYKKP